MSRDITAATETASSSDTVNAAYIVEMEFDAGTVRLWSGIGSLSWDGQSWDGVGELGGISSIQEEAGAVSTGISLELSFNDTDILDDILNEDYQGRSVRVWLAFFDNSMAIVDDPVQVFGGLMDSAETSLGRESASVRLNCESWLRVLERKTSRMRTDQDQDRRYSGDRGFEHVPQIQDKPIIWGRDDATQTKQSRKNLKKQNKR